MKFTLKKLESAAESGSRASERSLGTVQTGHGRESAAGNVA